MTEPGPCAWCNSGTECVEVHCRPFLGRTLWRVKCHSYPCKLMTYTAYGWTREAAVARYNRKCEKTMKKGWNYEKKTDD